MIEFKNEVRGFHHGQMDQTLNAYQNNEYVGHINYSVYDNEPYIEMINVPEKYRRQGIGRILVLKLQSMFPTTEINLGMLTDDGNKLIASLKTKILYNKTYKLKKAKLDKLKQIEQNYNDIFERFKNHKSEKAISKLIELNNHWNEVHSKIDELDRQLIEMKPSKRIFIE